VTDKEKNEWLGSYKKTCFTFLIVSYLMIFLHVVIGGGWIIFAYALLCICQIHTMYCVRRTHAKWVRACETLERVEKFLAENKQEFRALKERS
jgi:hypothetical protein